MDSELLGVVYRNVSIQFTITRASPEVTLNNIRWTFTPTNGPISDITNKSVSGKAIFNEALTRLDISNISMEDEGLYTLTATNPAGVRSATVNISVEGKTT